MGIASSPLPHSEVFGRRGNFQCLAGQHNREKPFALRMLQHVFANGTASDCPYEFPPIVACVHIPADSFDPPYVPYDVDIHEFCFDLHRQGIFAVLQKEVYFCDFAFASDELCS